KIVAKIELTDNATENVDINYYSNCPQIGTKQKYKTKGCDGVKVGQKIDFEIELKVKDCSKRRQVIAISPIGIREYSYVEVDVLCDCDCESHSNFTQKNSKLCSDNGDLLCGQCFCHSNYYGKQCECFGEGIAEQEKLVKCRRDINSTILCSNRGKCVCGQCECSESEVYGKYCECDRSSCGTINGKTCGGADRGECCDGACICKEGWTGDLCDCTLNTSSCISPINQKVCSGNGECHCGSCKCFHEKDTAKFAGKYCEYCATCEERCTDLQLYIDFEKAEYKGANCKERWCNFTLEVVDQIANISQKDRKCVFFDSDECQKTFVYSYDELTEKIKVKLKKKRDCREPGVNIWVVIGTIAGFILFVGIIVLLIFRLLVYIKDKREYMLHAKNEESDKRNMELKQPNPLYKEPNKQYNNPMYEQQKS
ncbi:hypothetical protein B4U79_09790, partial [Dinothrombium tinctorium]